MRIFDDDDDADDGLDRDCIRGDGKEMYLLFLSPTRDQSLPKVESETKKDVEKSGDDNAIWERWEGMKGDKEDKVTEFSDIM